MAIFGIIKSDDKVFVGDKLLINVSESFLAVGLSFATVSHEISLDAGITWYNVSDKKGMNWIFSSAGVKTISLRVSTSEPASQIFTKDILVLDLTAAKLFSTDSDLYKYESDIDIYMPKKWSSWNIIHLAAQDWIMDWLDEKRIFNEQGQKYTVADILDVQQVRLLSVYKTLEFIFESNSNSVGDVFSTKKDKYKLLANEKLERSQLALDFNANAVYDPEERTDLRSVVVRRA